MIYPEKKPKKLYSKYRILSLSLALTSFCSLGFCNEVSLDQNLKESIALQENLAYKKKSDSSYMENSSVQQEQNTMMNSKVTIGGNYTYIHLKPNDNPSFHGSLGGAQVMYEYLPLNRFYGGVRFDYKQGTAHGTNEKRSLLYFDVQERLGYTFGFLDDKCSFTLFSGFGYHYLAQHLTTTPGASVRFNYNEFYFPVGFLSDYEVNSWFMVGLNFTWMAQVYPTTSIVPLKGARWDLSYTMVNFYASLPLTFTLTDDKRFLLTVNPFYEHWKDGHSTAVLSTGAPLGLPSNTYNYGGVDVNLSYRF